MKAHAVGAVLAAAWVSVARAEPPLPPSPDVANVPACRMVRCELSVSWARLPGSGTWISGTAFHEQRETSSLTLGADALQLWDPRPDSENVRMLLFGGFVGRRIAGGRTAALDVEYGATLFLAVIGDVGVGAPGIGGGLSGTWRIGEGIDLVAYGRLTVPFPIADAGAAVRLNMGRITASLGWRDVRFVPVFGLPGRYASGPLAALALTM